MSCTTEFVDSLCELLRPLGEVRARKMMGDYVIYLNEKCVITACDNLAYIKKLPCVADLMASAEVGIPYPGAKEAYILPLSDPLLTRRALSLLWPSLPFPKKRK